MLTRRQRDWPAASWGMKPSYPRAFFVCSRAKSFTSSPSILSKTCLKCRLLSSLTSKFYWTADAFLDFFTTSSFFYSAARLPNMAFVAVNFKSLGGSSLGDESPVTVSSCVSRLKYSSQASGGFSRDASRWRRRISVMTGRTVFSYRSRLKMIRAC